MSFFLIEEFTVGSLRTRLKMNYIEALFSMFDYLSLLVLLFFHMLSSFFLSGIECSHQAYRSSWIGHETTVFWTFLLKENLMISGTDSQCFLLVCGLFPIWLLTRFENNKRIKSKKRNYGMVVMVTNKRLPDFISLFANYHRFMRNKIYPFLLLYHTICF